VFAEDSGYKIYSEAQSKQLFIKSSSGGMASILSVVVIARCAVAAGEYDGWCWPGSSGYLDFTSPVTRDWWASQVGL
jgi:alpha 1,3-glucosidase